MYLSYPNEMLGAGGHITYAQLPTGGGTWANGGPLTITGGTVTLGGSLVVTGQINTGGAGGNSGDWNNTNSSIAITGTNDAFNPSFNNTSFNSVAPNISAAMLFKRARGTSAAPTKVLAGDTLGGFFGGGYKDTGFSGNSGAFKFLANENFTDTATGTRLIVELAANGATGRTEVISISTVGFLFEVPAILKAYTVATLPAGSTGMRAYVTDALAPAYGVAVAGGGAVRVPVFYNGAAWVTA